MQIEAEVLHLLLDFWKKLSERHATRTHSPLLFTSFERMTATSQQVKILKLVLGSTAVFFFFFSSEQRKSGILQTSQNSLYFPGCLCSLCCYPLKAQYDPQIHQTLFVVIFNIKYPFRDYLMLLSVYSLLDAYTLLTKCKTNWAFWKLALQ